MYVYRRLTYLNVSLPDFLFRSIQGIVYQSASSLAPDLSVFYVKFTEWCVKMELHSSRLNL
jgi:hypothetical protein